MLSEAFSNTIVESLDLKTTLVIICTSIILGFLISLTYMFTNRKRGYSTSFVVTLIILPTIIAMIILLVGNNVARAFSLAGAFSIIRFRSAPGDSKDISYVFFTLGVGLACGMGYILYAVLFAIILCFVMVIIRSLKFTKDKERMSIRIVVPEDMNYEGVFDETFSLYTKSYKLSKVKTAEFGSVFEITYDIILKDPKNSKEFIDDLRTKNGNLKIMLSLKEGDNLSF